MEANLLLMLLQIFWIHWILVILSSLTSNCWMEVSVETLVSMLCPYFSNSSFYFEVIEQREGLVGLVFLVKIFSFRSMK